MSSDRDKAQAKQGRIAAAVIAGTGALWVGAQWLGAKYGWSNRTFVFFDLAALAAFIWALVVTYQIWRKRQDN
ncbi:DUF5337 domain-containing protein [Pseudogemmobacter sp. W21_MBD1_M6]|jgi:hypothetical protein|uniref:DUF5337 domain-containing protein n=1 Tax=Pseudogemmobacter sp. W21_MBD1_M6 TaxID=3240271 RepID=UPI003F9B0C34